MAQWRKFKEGIKGKKLSSGACISRKRGECFSPQVLDTPPGTRLGMFKLQIAEEVIPTDRRIHYSNVNATIGCLLMLSLRPVAMAFHASALKMPRKKEKKFSFE
jgi:hypothetical protein